MSVELPGNAEEVLAGSSQEQRDAEEVMIHALNDRLGVQLKPTRVALPRGGRVEVDGADEGLSVICEAWAHQGAPKSAQRMKVITDAFKLAFIARGLDSSPRLILLFSDLDAAEPFQGKRWFAQAIAELGIEVMVVELPADVRGTVLAAQKRQFR